MLSHGSFASRAALTRFALALLPASAAPGNDAAASQDGSGNAPGDTADAGQIESAANGCDTNSENNNDGGDNNPENTGSGDNDFPDCYLAGDEICPWCKLIVGEYGMIGCYCHKFWNEWGEEISPEGGLARNCN